MNFFHGIKNYFTMGTWSGNNSIMNLLNDRFSSYELFEKTENYILEKDAALNSKTRKTINKCILSLIGTTTLLSPDNYRDICCDVFDKISNNRSKYICSDDFCITNHYAKTIEQCVYHHCAQGNKASACVEDIQFSDKHGRPTYNSYEQCKNHIFGIIDSVYDIVEIETIDVINDEIKTNELINQEIIKLNIQKYKSLGIF